ncbi:MAG: class I SAM-dependent methyltransferase [Pseudoxanthomonas sp.]
MTDWSQVPLPDAWPDRVAWWRLREWPRLWRKLSGRQREPVRLPEELPGMEKLPRYLLLEFHNLPNGNYSRHITRGYVRGFDRAMLGSLRHGRKRIAEALRGARRALDLGSGAGYVASALREAGVGEVWGLEPSPYLLNLAAQREPGVRWVQGVGEDSGLPDAHFDAVGICFVLHEVPPAHIRKLCAELRRITVPGATLAVLEPSPLQWRNGVWRMWKSHGWRGAYFRLLATRVYEPFAQSWHKLDFAALLAEHGFDVERDETGCPFRFFVARRRGVQPLEIPQE